MRLRQAAVVCRDLSEGRAAVEALGCRAPFRDSMVAEFGLENAVYTIGDTFLEVLAPVEQGVSAARFLDRRGGVGLHGYMLLIQVEDLDVIRAAVRRLGVREVWSIVHDDVRSLHVHPGDLGAVVSFEEAVPASSWRWGGPAWHERAVPGRLRAVEIGGAPRDLWSSLLGRGDVGGALVLDDGSEIRFVDGSGITAIELEIDGSVVQVG